MAGDDPKVRIARRARLELHRGDAEGNLANWIVPGRPILGVGGAMDLAAGARRVVALMTHAADGKPKLVDVLTLPLTAPRCVDTVVTELAVFKIRADGAELIEI